MKDSVTFIKNGDFRILVVDDDSIILKVITQYLKNHSYLVDSAQSGNEAVDKVRNYYYDLVLLDLKLPDRDGISVLKDIKKISREISVIIMTGFGRIETAVEAIKKGADDYLLKPFKSMEELSISIKKALEYRELKVGYNSLKEQLNISEGFYNIVGKSRKMQEVFKLIQKVAPINSTVLIEGESGTGKELVARAIHKSSPRSKKIFVAINCGAIPVNLLESELFGYERGSFTGAESTKKGYFEVADGGTIFLDEISEMDESLQVKLLRVLQERKFYRIGGREEIKSDVRVIASTNKNLENEVAKNKFRKDLYYRINVIKITVPPLRERTEDIPLLVSHFLSKYAKEFGKTINGVSPKVMDVFVKYRWEGNVRELENIIEHAVAMAETDEILPDDIPDEIFRSSNRIIASNIERYEEAKHEFEKKYLEKVLKETAGNIAEAARISSIPRQNIYDKIKKLGIDVNLYRSK